MVDAATGFGIQQVPHVLRLLPTEATVEATQHICQTESIRGDACRERRTFEMGRRERAVAPEIEMPQQLLHPRTRLLRQARRRRRHETRFLARRPPRSPTTTLPYPADRRALGFATEARLEPRILLLLFALLHL